MRCSSRRDLIPGIHDETRAYVCIVVYLRCFPCVKLIAYYTAHPPLFCHLQVKAKKGKPGAPARVQGYRAKPDGWFEYIKVVLRVLCVTFRSDSIMCPTRSLCGARSARACRLPFVRPLGVHPRGGGRARSLYATPPSPPPPPRVLKDSGAGSATSKCP